MTAAALIGAAGAWGIAGLAVAAAFLLVGLDRIDPAARGAYAFRPLLVPGIVLLWPVVLLRWAQIEGGRGVGIGGQRGNIAAARRVWQVFALLLPVLLGAAALLRGAALPETPSLRLSVPAPTHAPGGAAPADVPEGAAP